MTQEDALNILIQVADASILKGGFLTRPEIVVIDKAISMFTSEQAPVDVEKEKGLKKA